MVRVGKALIKSSMIGEMVTAGRCVLTAKLWVSNIFFDCAEKKLPLKVADWSPCFIIYAYLFDCLFLYLVVASSAAGKTCSSDPGPSTHTVFETRLNFHLSTPSPNNPWNENSSLKYPTFVPAWFSTYLIQIVSNWKLVSIWWLFQSKVMLSQNTRSIWDTHLAIHSYMDCICQKFFNEST